jgi:hypothetical protein
VSAPPNVFGPSCGAGIANRSRRHLRRVRHRRGPVRTRANRPPRRWGWFGGRKQAGGCSAWPRWAFCSGEVLFGDDESVLVEHVLGERAVSAANLLWGVKDKRGHYDHDPDDDRGQRPRAAHQLPGRRGRRAAKTATVPTTVISTSSNAATRACLLFADTMMNGERAEEYATEEGGGVLVVAGGDATPLLEAPETTLDGVAFAVAVLVPRPAVDRRPILSPCGVGSGRGVRGLCARFCVPAVSFGCSGASTPCRPAGGTLRCRGRGARRAAAPGRDCRPPVPARAAASAGSRTCR